MSTSSIGALGMEESPFPRYQPVRGVTRDMISNSSTMVEHQVQGNVQPLPKTYFPKSFELISFGQIAVALQGTSSALKQQALTQLIDLLKHPKHVPLMLVNSQSIFGEGKTTITVSEEELKTSVSDTIELSLQVENGEANVPISGHLGVRNSGPKYPGRLLQDVIDTFGDEDAECRRLACVAYELVTASPVGLEASTKYDYTKEIFTLIEDRNPDCRLYAFKILYNLTQNRVCLERMLKRSLVEALLMSCAREKRPNIQEANLRVLCSVLKMTTGVNSQPPEQEVVSLLTSVMATAAATASAAESSVLVPALKCLSYICVHDAGKELVIKMGALQHIYRHVSNPNNDIREAATNAAMILTALLEAKKVAVEMGLVATLWELRNDRRDSTLAYALQTLTNLAELPASRTSGLLDSPAVAKDLTTLYQTHPRITVRSAAESALKRIQWKP